MADWPLRGGARYSTTAGANLTAGLVNTKGNYADVIAATGFAARELIVVLCDSNQINADYLVDLAVGPAGAEQIIAANLYAASSGTSIQSAWPHYQLPVSIPAGTRIAARCQCSTASKIIACYVTLVAADFLSPQPLGSLATYGANVADSGGISIDPGAAAWNKGAWVQITAASTTRTRLIWPALGNQLNAGRTAGVFFIDIGVGGAGSEVVVVPDYIAHALAGDDGFSPSSYGPLPVDIPAGSRIAVRASSSVTDATDRLLDVILYCAN